MATFEAVRASYRPLWTGMTINPDKQADADIAAKRVLAGETRYKAVEAKTGVPWFFIGLCHLREGNLNFQTYLGNGQNISRVTTIVPVGRGPFSSFEEGAIDALKLKKLTLVMDWTLEQICYALEGFNGFGYRQFHVNSPYLWAGTNRYTKGKYIRDHVFDANTVDKQLGSMAVLWRMCALNVEVAGRVNGTQSTAPVASTPVNQPVPVPPAKLPASSNWLAALITAIASLFKPKG